MLNKQFSQLKNINSYFTRLAVKNFSSDNQSNGSMSLRFHELYVKELERIKKTSSELVAAKYKVNNISTPNEAYIHPYHSTKFPIYWSTRNLTTFLSEAVGTEPVSPHYESFVRSRRYLVLTGGMIWVISLMDQLNLNSFYGQHGIYEFYTLILFCIGIFEMRYITQKLPAPRLTWFYTAYIEHEMKQFWLNWQDKIEELSRPFLAISKEQIDFYLIHKEFLYIKKRSLSIYLENEKKNLEKHFYDRTLQMLKSVEQMENSNVKQSIRQAIEEALKVVLIKVESEQERKSLHENSFNSALLGLKTGKMTYENDALLPLLISEVKKRLEPLKKLSAEQEKQMFALSANQKKLLAEYDRRSKIEYLANPPDVSSASVKNSDSYKGIIARMKTRIETNFKI